MPAISLLNSIKPVEDDDVVAVTLQELVLEDGTRVRHTLAQVAEQRVQEAGCRLTRALKGSSDLVPNVYEGGLKVWECSIDLTQYLTSLNIAFRGLKVLELGCGAGLPGLYTFVKGAHTHFQDYNREVIEYVTIPNVRHNCLACDEGGGEVSDLDPDCKDPRMLPKVALDLGVCRFFAGDWGPVKHLLLSNIKTADEKYDIILTSETIYCPDNYKKIHETMQSLLKPQGVIYLSAKTYYFGVGGGLREFETKVHEWGMFDIKSCRQFTEGVQREIMELRFKKQTAT